jgi:hypothetical protein
MSGKFQAGHLVPVTWQASGGANFLLNIKEQDLALIALLLDVTGYKAGGLRARLAGVIDIEGRIVCDMDADEPPYLAPPLILPGVSGIAVFGTTIARGIQCPLICEKLHQSGGTEKELMWDANWKSNSLAGLLVFPAL